MCFFTSLTSSFLLHSVVNISCVFFSASLCSLVLCFFAKLSCTSQCYVFLRFTLLPFFFLALASLAFIFLFSTGIIFLSPVWTLVSFIIYFFFFTLDSLSASPHLNLPIIIIISFSLSFFTNIYIKPFLLFTLSSCFSLPHLSFLPQYFFSLAL